MISLGRNRPLVALRSISALVKNPDELTRAFDVIGALPGRSDERMLAKLRASADADRLFGMGASLGGRLSDRAALLALPDGSLGRAYVEFAARAGISAAGFVDAGASSSYFREGDSDELRFVHERMRDSHDLWHVVTGYGVDPLGEIFLLSFLMAQSRHPGIALGLGVVTVRALGAGLPEIHRMMRVAYRRGANAVYLPAVIWEDLLARPLGEVREQLRVGASPVYTSMSIDALRTAGLLPATG
jgi:ubiquinone biosynthesis protein COQ4